MLYANYGEFITPQKILASLKSTWKMKLLFACIVSVLVLKTSCVNYRLRKMGIPVKKFNVCRRLSEYSTNAINKNECWYNPDVDTRVPDIIHRYGYRFKSYKVTSNDSYITTLFRIPGRNNDTSKKSGQPVFLLHGLATSSDIMVDTGKHSLAFALVNAGYDVWLGNLRGSSYSIGHKSISYMNPDYWEFSFHEMGVYDLPANLELVKNKTGSQVIFIGHSLGASVFHVFESYHRALSKQLVKVAVSLAPVVFLSNLQPPQPQLAELGNPLLAFANLMKIKTSSTHLQNMSRRDYSNTLCKSLPPILRTCRNGFYQAFGLGSKQIPPHYLPLLLAHNPSGFSINIVNHLLQIVENDGTFQAYDYGVAKNLQIYNDAFPTEYNVSGCETPIVIFYGAGDWLSTEEDIDRLIDTIENDAIVKGKHKINADTWKHMDYFYARRAESLFYKKLLGSLKEFTQNAAEAAKNAETAKEPEASAQQPEGDPADLS